MNRRRAGLAGPFTRLRRDPLAVVAAILVAMLAATSAGIHQSSQRQVAGFVDAHWRGAYDLLVRPPGSRLDLTSTNGLVESDFIKFAGKGGISLDQLAAIRSIRGVALAAPIAFVGVVHSDSPSATVFVDHVPEKPTLYRVTIRVQVDDGLSPTTIQSTSGEVLLGPPAATGDPAGRWASSLGDVVGGIGEGGRPLIDLTVRQPLPDVSAPVIAVDPIAEQQLLGGGAFLAPLVELGGGKRTAETFDPALIPDAYALQQLRVQSAAPGTPVVPVIGASRVGAKVDVSAEFSQIGEPLDSYPSGGSAEALRKAREAAGTAVHAVGTASVSASDTLSPFGLVSIKVMWPGSSGQIGEGGVYKRNSNLEIGLYDRPSYSPAPDRGPDAGAPSFVIAPLGAVAIDGSTHEAAGGARFQSYRVRREVEAKTATTQPGADGAGFVIAPIGSFDPSAIAVPTDPLTYVPLGAYDPADTVFVAGPDGRRVDPRPMLYPLLPNGLIATPPLAITNLGGAETLRGDAPIDAIRVRVGGVGGFGPEAQATIKSVADAIARLGLEVDVVAGASPQNVDVYVPSYHVDSDPPSDLGWVRQRWTTLGAAARVSRGFADGDLALLVLSLLAAALWAVALAALRAERRIRDAAILRAIGWQRTSIVRWFLAESAVAAGVVAVAALAGYVLIGRTWETLVVGLAVAAEWLIVGAIVAFDSARRADPTRVGRHAGGAPWRALPAVTGAGSLALRMAIARSPWVAATAVGLGGAAAAVVLGTGLILGMSSRIGPTLLASATATAAAAYQPLTLAVLGVGSLVFACTALRLEQWRRAPDLLIMAASGWDSSALRRLALCGRVITAVVAAAFAAAATALLAHPFEVEPIGLFVVVASLLAATVVVWGGLTTRGVAARPGDV